SPPLSFHRSSSHPHLHSFPTRRSSDLAPSLPFERPVDKTSFSRASVPVRIDSSLRAKLETLARQYDVSLPVLLFAGWQALVWRRSEEHTSELQSRFDIVCRLLLEKKKR